MKIKIFLFALLLSFSFGQSTQVKDLTDVISPITIAPNPQNGYGIGNDQLAQTDDVEFLKDVTLVVSDVDNNRIQHFSDEGELIKSMTTNELGLNDKNIIPTGISKDAEGYIYVSLEGAELVARLTPELKLDQLR